MVELTAGDSSGWIRPCGLVDNQVVIPSLGAGLDLLLIISLGLGAYLVGSFPTAYVLVYLLTKQDIRQLGTRNVGALNTYHQVGAVGAAVVLLLDAGKGVLALLAPAWLGAPEWTVFMTTPLVLAGHNWPVFLRFRGGKGAATIFGVSLALVPVLTLITLGPVILVSLLTRNVVLGTAFGFIQLNTLLLVTDQGPDQVALCVLLTLVVTVTYLVSTRAHVVNSIKSRRWKELFTGLA
jgi:glycerol-3-phosphate acyltransferase PlsY